MYRTNVEEAAPVVQRLLTHLAGCIRHPGLAGSQARTAIGQTPPLPSYRF